MLVILEIAAVVFLIMLLVYRYRHSLVRIISQPVKLLFHYFYYRENTWANTHWMGVPLLKLPLDLWRYHDILWETRPDVIIETGTNKGGSALYMAQLCDIIGRGRVVTIDIAHPPEGLPTHPRITYVLGSSTDPKPFEVMVSHIKPGEKVMVILDSDHARDHVTRELELYAPLVSEGHYLVVEDTNVYGHPVYRSHGPGPMEALDAFRPMTKGFQVDSKLEEKYQMTFFPRGWLKRVSIGAGA
jgi:cephalosporin hydroxylase